MNQAKLSQVAAPMPGVKCYTQADELIADPDVQIVSIASYDDHHAGQIAQALRLGKHVFSEKPLCLNRAELHAIVAAWRGAGGARLSTNTMLRCSPRFRWVKDAIDVGKLGTVYCIEGEYVYGRLHKLTSGWRGRIPGYSVMLGGGIHIIDLMLWVSAQRPIEVVAYGSRLGSAHTEFKGIDLVVALLRFESGLIGRISANFASVYPHFHRFVVYGTEGTFENLPSAVSSAGRLWKGRDDGHPPSEVAEPYPGVSKGALIPSFVDAVLGRGDPEVREDHAFACVGTALAIEEAVATGRPTIVKYE
jgi:predicted dehydrogenase